MEGLNLSSLCLNDDDKKQVAITFGYQLVELKLLLFCNQLESRNIHRDVAQKIAITAKVCPSYFAYLSDNYTDEDGYLSGVGWHKMLMRLRTGWDDLSPTQALFRLYDAFEFHQYGLAFFISWFQIDGTESTNLEEQSDT